MEKRTMLIWGGVIAVSLLIFAPRVPRNIRNSLVPCERLDRMLKISGCMQRVNAGTSLGIMRLSTDEEFIVFDRQFESGGVIYEFGKNELINVNPILIGMGDRGLPNDAITTDFAFARNKNEIAIIVENSTISFRHLNSSTEAARIELSKLPENEDESQQLYDIGVGVIDPYANYGSITEETLQESNLFLDVQFFPEGDKFVVVDPVEEIIDIYRFDPFSELIDIPAEFLQTIPGKYLAFAPHKEQIAVGSADGEISIWEEQSGKYTQVEIIPPPSEINEFNEFNPQIKNGDYLHYSADGSVLAVTATLQNPKDDEQSYRVGMVQLIETESFNEISSFERPLLGSYFRTAEERKKDYLWSYHSIFEFDGEFIYWATDALAGHSTIVTWNGEDVRSYDPNAYFKVKKWDLEGNLVYEREFKPSEFLTASISEIVISPKNQALVIMTDAPYVELWSIAD